LSEAMTSVDDDAKSLKVAIQYTISSIRAKQCLKLLASLGRPLSDPSATEPQTHTDLPHDEIPNRCDHLDSVPLLELMERHSHRTRSNLSETPIDRNSADRQTELTAINRVLVALSDALEGLCACRKQDQYHPNSVYRVSYVLDRMSDLLSSGHLHPLPATFTSKLTSLGLASSHESAWTGAIIPTQNYYTSVV
jgi:hypothetical protein